MYTPHAMTWYEGTKSGTTTTWTRHEVTPIMWQATEISVGDSQGVTATDRATIYVPLSSGTFTFKRGDVLVKGIVSDAITSGFTISALLAKYADSIRIRQADKKDYGSAGAQHWALRGGV